MKLEFIGEIKETKQTKTVSLDNVYQVRIVTDNSEILDLGKLPPDTLVKIIIQTIK